MTLLAIAIWGGAAILLLLLSRSQWPRWMGAPLMILVARAAIDVGFSVVPGFGHAGPTPFVGVPDERETLHAIGLILLCYASIGAGLLAAKGFNRSGTRSIHVGPVMMPLSVQARAWRASTTVFLFGSAMSLISMIFLIAGGSSVLDLAKRTAYVDPAALSNLSYNLARLLSSAMLVGGLAMILFARGAASRRVAFLAVFLTGVSEAILGGRSQAVTVIVGLLLAAAWTRGRFRVSTIAWGFVATMLLLSYLYTARFESTSQSEVATGIVEDVTTTRRVDEMAFILRQVPQAIPHTEWSPVIAGFSHTLPTLGLPGAENMWQTVVRTYFRGRNPSAGIGGFTFPTAAEFYLSFGTLGIVGLGLGFGLLFGLLFEWQRKRLSNPFVALVTILFFLAFFGGVTARMSAAVGGLATGFLVPAFLIAALALRSSLSDRTLIAAYGAVLSLLAYVLVNGGPYPQGALLSALAKGFTMAALLGLYFWGFLLVSRSGSVLRGIAPAHRPHPLADPARPDQKRILATFDARRD